MRRLSHPITKWTYEWADDGVGPVQVTDGHGADGRFDRDGRWVAGAMFAADPEMCRWICSGGREAGGSAGRSRRFALPSQRPEPEVSV